VAEPSSIIASAVPFRLQYGKVYDTLVGYGFSFPSIERCLRALPLVGVQVAITCSTPCLISLSKAAIKQCFASVCSLCAPMLYCMSQGSASESACLDWLCLHLPDSELPRKFSSGMRVLQAAEVGVVKAN
jgi:hypothetical protein